MQVQVQRISPVVLELSVEVPVDQVTAELDKAYASLARTAHIKGFRKGKAPRNVLTQLFAAQVENDVANALVNGTLPQVLAQQNVTPISQPRVEAGRVLQKDAFSYKARFEVQPEIEEPKFEGLELKKPKADVADSLVDEEIEGLRARHASLKAPEPARPAKKGDVLTIDFTLSLEGKEVKDGGGQGVQLELGSGQALPEIDTALEGKGVGDTAEASHPFPADHPRTDFRGKTGVFAIKVTDLKERVLANLDDELAKDIGFDTLVALRADVHTKLEKASKERSEMAVAEQIVDQLNDLNPCDVPPSLVLQQAQIMEQEVILSARRVGQRFTKEQVDELQAKIKTDAEKKVRAGLIMAAIAKKHEFKVTDEDLENGLKELAEETGKNVAKLRVEYREKAKRDILVGMILEDKILDFIESKAKIAEGEAPAAAAASK